VTEITLAYPFLTAIISTEMKTSSILLASLLLGFSTFPLHAQEAAVPAAEPVILADLTVGETNALVGAINKFRTDLNLAPLAVDSVLSERAAAAFPAVANAPGEVDVTALRKEFAASNVAVLRGVVTHRKEASGAEFPKYWAKDPQWNAVMAGDFTHIGASTAKRSDGKLVAFAYLIRK
jgi:hypothetical protein